MKPTSTLLISTVALTASADTSSKLVPLRVTASSDHPLYDAEVTIGNQTFLLLADTGSSDTWVVKTGYKCFSGLTGAELEVEACEYSNTTYDPSPTYEKITNQTFGAKFGRGLSIGDMAYEDVTIGDITVHRQKIGVADTVTLTGDGVDSGILGLGYPILTSAHPGSERPPNETLLFNRVTYDPVFTRMYKQGSTEPWFSLSLDRLPSGDTSGPGGYLGLGELPPVELSSDFVKAPVEITEGIPVELTGGVRKITEWTLGVEAVAWGSRSGSSLTTNSTRFQAVVDSGNYFNQIPQPVAGEILKAYNPPAVLDPETEMYVVDCDAETPALGLTIAGRTFYHLPEDMILKRPDGSCVSTILPPAGGEGDLTLNFLGDAFMNNVVSVFDFGANEMRFAARADGGGVVARNASVTTAAPSPTATSGGDLGARVSMGGVMTLFATALIVVLAN